MCDDVASMHQELRRDPQQNFASDSPTSTATSTPSHSSSSSFPTFPPPLSEPEKSGLSAGAKAGIAIGVILAFLIAAVIAFLVLRKRRQSKNLTAEGFVADDPGYIAPEMVLADQVGGRYDQPVLTSRK
jgi:hypothetical protein